MDRFGSFRHLFRQAYSFQLEWSRFAPGVAAAQGVFDEFERRVCEALPSHEAVERDAYLERPVRRLNVAWS